MGKRGNILLTKSGYKVHLRRILYKALENSGITFSENKKLIYEEEKEKKKNFLTKPVFFAE